MVLNPRGTRQSPYSSLYFLSSENPYSHFCSIGSHTNPILSKRSCLSFERLSLEDLCVLTQISNLKPSDVVKPRGTKQSPYSSLYFLSSKNPCSHLFSLAFQTKPILSKRSCLSFERLSLEDLCLLIHLSNLKPSDVLNPRGTRQSPYSCLYSTSFSNPNSQDEVDASTITVLRAEAKSDPTDKGKSKMTFSI